MRLLRQYTWVVLVSAIVAVSGCSATRKAEEYASQPASVAESPAASGPGGLTGAAGRPPAAPGLASRLALLGPSSNKPTSGAPNALTIAAISESAPERYLIKDARIALEVADVRRASASLLAA